MHLNSWTIPSNIIKINLSVINNDVYNHLVIRTSDFFYSLHVILTQFTSIEIWIELINCSLKLIISDKGTCTIHALHNNLENVMWIKPDL